MPVNMHTADFAILLMLLFIGLKLTGHITWSWVWVLSPAWIVLSAVIIIVVVAVVTALLQKRA